MSNDELDKIEKALDELGCKEEYINERSKFIARNIVAYKKYETLSDVIDEPHRNFAHFCGHFDSCEYSFKWERSYKGHNYWMKIFLKLLEIYKRDVAIPIVKKMMLLMKKNKVPYNYANMPYFSVYGYDSSIMFNDDDRMMDRLIRIAFIYEVYSLGRLCKLVYDHTVWDMPFHGRMRMRVIKTVKRNDLVL